MAQSSVSAVHDRLAGSTLGQAPAPAPQPEVFTTGQG